MAHLYWQAENLDGTEITNTSTPQKVVELSVPVESGKTYVLIAYYGTDDAYLTAPHTFDLADVTGSPVVVLDTAQEVCQVAGNDEFASGTLLVQYTAEATETVKFQIRAKAANATGLTAKGRLIAIRNETGDQFAYQASEQQNSTVTPASALDLTFTPSETSDYAVIANFVYRNDSGSSRYNCHFYDGTTAYSPSLGVYAFPSAKYKGSSIALPMLGISGEQTWSFRHWSQVAGNNIRTRTAAIAAFKIQSGQDFQNGAATSVSSNSTGTLAVKISLTKTFKNAPYLLAASATFGVATANKSAELQVSAAGAEVGPSFSRGINVSGYRYPYAFAAVVSHLAAPQTDSLTYGPQDGATAVSPYNARLIALELASPTASVDLAGAGTATATGTGSLTTFGTLAGAGEAETVGTGALQVTRGMAVAAVATALGIAALTVGPPRSSSRPLSVDMGSAVTSGEVRPALLLEAEFASGTVYLWTGVGTLSWNGKTWLGGGQFLSVDQVQEGQQLEAVTTVVTISSISSEWISYALQESQTGGVGRMYLGLFDTNGALINDPYVIFQGRLSVPKLSDDGQTATLSVSYDSLLADLFRTRNLRYTDASQKALFPGDRGLEYDTAMASWSGQWGPKVA